MVGSEPIFKNTAKNFDKDMWICYNTGGVLEVNQDEIKENR